MRNRKRKYVTLVTKKELKNLDPGAIEKYLLSQKWELIAYRPNKSKSFFKGDLDVLLPLDKTFRDYNTRIFQVIQGVCADQNISVQAAYSHLLSATVEYVNRPKQKKPKSNKNKPKKRKYSRVWVPKDPSLESKIKADQTLQEFLNPELEYHDSVTDLDFVIDEKGDVRLT